MSSARVADNLETQGISCKYFLEKPTARLNEEQKTMFEKSGRCLFFIYKLYKHKMSVRCTCQIQVYKSFKYQNTK